MADDNTRKLDSVEKFLNLLEKDVLGGRNMKRIGNITKEIVYKRVKIGFGVNKDDVKPPGFPRRRRLKKLSPGYVDQRQRDGVRGKFGSPSFSNLTNTGQLLDSFIVNSAFANFVVRVPNSFRREGGLTNAAVARFVSQNGRPFFAITRAERQIIQNALNAGVRKAFARAFRSV